MTIELTADQAQALATECEPAIVLNPLTQQTYRLVRNDLGVNHSIWTPDEMAILAGEAFGKLDDIDYSEYLKDPT